MEFQGVIIHGGNKKGFSPAFSLRNGFEIIHFLYNRFRNECTLGIRVKNGEWSRNLFGNVTANGGKQEKRSGQDRKSSHFKQSLLLHVYFMFLTVSDCVRQTSHSCHWYDMPSYCKKATDPEHPSEREWKRVRRQKRHWFSNCGGKRSHTVPSGNCRRILHFHR